MARTPDLHKRHELAQHAWAYLRDRGWGQVTMTEMARALGLKRPTLYWYFPDLESLFEAVLEAFFEAQERAVQERLQHLNHPIDLLYAHLTGVHALYLDREEEIVALIQLWAMAGSGQASRTLALLRGRYLPRRDAAVALLRAGQEAGYVAPCDPEALVALIGALTDGLLIQRILTNAPLGPIHHLIWEHLLQPLRLQPHHTSTPREAHHEHA